MGVFGQFKVLVQISLRSLASHKVKSLIVGGILVFGAFLFVLGTTMLDNIERAMEESITGSLVGHLQIHSDQAKDDLAFYGPNAGSQPDLGVIEDFRGVKAALETLPNVDAVVPMGRDMAVLVGGNAFDEQLGLLREAVQQNDGARISLLASRLRHMAEMLVVEMQNRAEFTDDDAADEKLSFAERAASDAFWEDFDSAPLPALDFLDTKVAPLQADEAVIMVPYVGTDVDAFAKKFHRFKIVQGGMIPSGERGFLFNRAYYEETSKNKVARGLDVILKDVRGGKLIARDSALQESVKHNQRQYRRLLLDLDPESADDVERDLRAFLGEEGDLDALARSFLLVDDSNVEGRHAFFYEKIAPRMRLYRVNVGDTVTIRAFTRSGYTRAANLKVYGTFQFDDLDDSKLASRYSVIDIASFRDLYGLMTPERRRELDAMRKSVGVQDVTAAEAEDALFGEGGSIEFEVDGGDLAPEPVAEPVAGTLTAAAKFTQDDVLDGVVLHAAVVLKDRTQIRETWAAIEKMSEERGLGLKVVGWQQAAGIVGQFIFVLKGVLLIAIGIIFAVALVIINNSMLMATMDRVSEIGTMRAIGAQRRFVLSMFLLETVVLGALAGGLGALLAAGVVKAMHSVGLPASNEVLVLLFGGSLLRPELAASNVVSGMVLIFVVSIAATLYPARIATRIAPVVAMQRRE